MTSHDDEMLNARDVCRFTGLARSTIWKLERRGDFPRRFKLTERRVGWRRGEVEAWLANRRA